mgnify:CR=1 FL=1
MKSDFQKIEECFELTSKETFIVLLSSFKSALLPFILGAMIFGMCLVVLNNSELVDTIIYGCYKEIIGILFLIWSLIVVLIVVQTYNFKYDEAVRNKYHHEN